MIFKRKLISDSGGLYITLDHYQLILLMYSASEYSWLKKKELIAIVD